ncbi:YhgE/Pip domain-containing protein [Bifidobacterium callimiconis]|uniref:YhgE/Pip family protein n=1 Tax=Bifidobacterium callimiconis TaxID=2306973 RepID=UPI001BDD01CD|nr:YhgE/Pip domain-containing protein [Bifidobacterium callimiconis]
MTSQGADAVQAQVNEVFDTTISTVGLTIASELVDALDSDSATTLVGNLNTNIAQTAGRLNATADNLDQYGEVIASAQSLIDSSSDLVGKASDSAKAAQTATDQAKQGVASVSDALNSSAQSVSDALGQSADSYTTAAADIDTAMAAIGTQGADTSKQLRALASKLDGQISSYQTLRGNLAALDPQTDAGKQALERTLADLDDSIAKQQSVRDTLNSTADSVDKGMANADQASADAKAKAQAARTAMDQASRNFDSGLKKKLDGMASAVSSAYSDGTEAATRLQSTVDDLSGSANSIASNMTAAHGKITAAAQTLRDSADKMTALHDKIQKALDSDDMQAVKTALGDDPATLAASMVSPTGVNRHAVFTVENFGSAMAPMYTALAMWLGALLMSLAILTQVSRERMDTLDRPRPHELYLGRFGVFAFVALLQSTVTCLGELAYLRIQCEHPMLFMLTGWTTSLVFAFIVYTLVVSFGNPGKALCVLIMVMQITGAGGAFPVAMLPEFFQNVHPFLPATHAVDAFRSAIAGIYGNDYWISMGRLLAFVLPMLLLGLVLRKPLISFNAKSIATLGKTKVLG